MPPWNQMTPQQQTFLQMLMQHGGMQQPMGVPGQMPMAALGQMQPGLNPNTAALTNQLANPQAQQNVMQNPQFMQYLMALRGAQPPTVAQLMGGQQPVPAYTQYPGF